MDATYASSVSFHVAGDVTAIFIPGVRVRIDCGTDGIMYASVSSSAYIPASLWTTIQVSVDESVAITLNISSVLLCNDTPLSTPRATNSKYGSVLLASTEEAVEGITSKVPTTIGLKAAIDTYASSVIDSSLTSLATTAVQSVVSPIVTNYVDLNLHSEIVNQVELRVASVTPPDIGAAPAAKGVTNGDSHDHSGGDGGTIAYASLSGTPNIPTAYSSNAAGLGTASPGVSDSYARGDHVHPVTGLVTSTDFSSHTGNTSNPHGVTAAQVSALPLAGGTMTGELRLKRWLETVVALGNVSGALSIDLSAGQTFTMTVTGNITSISFSNAVPSGYSGGIILRVTNGGAYTINWSAFDKAGGTAPTLTASGVDLLTIAFCYGYDPIICVSQKDVK